MARETHINVFSFREAALDVSGWSPEDVVGDDRLAGLISGRQLRPDMFLTLPAHPPMVVECKLEESDGDPVEDAENKLGEILSPQAGRAAGQIIRKAVAVRYPPGAKGWELEDAKRRFLDGAEVRWKFLDWDDGEVRVWPQDGYLKGTISDFAGSVENSSADVGAVAEAGKAVALHVGAAAAVLEAALGNHPDEVERISARMGYPGKPEEGLRTAAVVWFDSLLILNELDRAGKSYGSTETCRVGKWLDGRAVLDAWRRVLEDNYRSIFKVAAECYPRVLTSAAYRDVFYNLDNAVAKVESELLGKTANIGGEVFAWVMDEGERKDAAAFYTRPENAEFLAHAVLPSRDDLPGAPMDWRIADFACGTGALLRAGYRRLRRFATAEALAPPMAEFHRRMMEDGLCGLDINPIAVHLTAAGIVGLQPGTAYQDINIGGMDLGRVSRGPAKTFKDVRVGSVELLDKDGSQRQMLRTDYFQLTGATPPEGGNVDQLSAEDKSFDAVLMNPPYSRARKGQTVYNMPWVSDAERPLLQRRDKWLTQGTCSNSQAGLSTTFAAIADLKLKPGGRVGLVMPLTAAAAGSFRKTREMFETGYRDVIAVALGGDGSISADTNMGEMMIFARKGTEGGRPGVGYAHIDAPLVSANAGAEIARVIVENLGKAQPGDGGPLLVGGDQVGSYYAAYPASPGDPWGGVGAEGLMNLYQDGDRLTAGVIHKEGTRRVEFPTTTIGELFDAGPTHHLIGHRAGFDPIGAFTLHERIPGRVGRETPHLSLWKTDSKSQVSVLTEPTHYGVVYRRDEAEKQVALKADMFYQRGMSWTSQKILVATAAEPALGGRAWAALRGGSEAVRLAFAIWANSIFGFVNHWMVGQRQQAGRSQTQIRDIQRIPCPDFTDPNLAARAEAYLDQKDELFGLELEPAVYADMDEERRRLNLVAADILGIPERNRSKIAGWFAERWTAEPKVQGNG